MVKHKPEKKYKYKNVYMEKYNIIVKIVEARKFVFIIKENMNVEKIKTSFLLNGQV